MSRPLDPYPTRRQLPHLIRFSLRCAFDKFLRVHFGFNCGKRITRIVEISSLWVGARGEPTSDLGCYVNRLQSATAQTDHNWGFYTQTMVQDMEFSNTSPPSSRH